MIDVLKWNSQLSQNKTIDITILMTGLLTSYCYNLNMSHSCIDDERNWKINVTIKKKIKDKNKNRQR